jgi:hypothetical protein
VGPLSHRLQAEVSRELPIGVEACAVVANFDDQ